MANYYVLLTTDEKGGAWTVEFSDYDKEVVEDERDDLHYGGAKKSLMKIVKIADANQSTINKKLEELNAPLFEKYADNVEDEKGVRPGRYSVRVKENGERYAPQFDTYEEAEAFFNEIREEEKVTEARLVDWCSILSASYHREG